MASKEDDFFNAEKRAQERLLELERLTLEQLDFERRLLLRTLLRDVFDRIQSGKLKTREDVASYVRAVEKAFESRFVGLATQLESEMEKIALARQTFYEKHQTMLDLVRDMERLQAVQRRFFVDFKSVPRDLSMRLRLAIVDLIDKQNIVGVNEKQTARAIQDIAQISFNKAYFIATQSQALYLGWHRYQQIKALGVTQFKYRGTIKNTTRDFCRFALGYPNKLTTKRKNNIWTMKDIEYWDKKTWKGKIEGVPLIVQAGGYRCRHAFIPMFE